MFERFVLKRDGDLILVVVRSVSRKNLWVEFRVCKVDALYCDDRDCIVGDHVLITEDKNTFSFKSLDEAIKCFKELVRKEVRNNG